MLYWSALEINFSKNPLGLISKYMKRANKVVRWSDPLPKILHGSNVTKWKINCSNFSLKLTYWHIKVCVPRPKIFQQYKKGTPPRIPPSSDIIGRHTKSISIANQTKGIPFLEIPPPGHNNKRGCVENSPIRSDLPGKQSPRTDKILLPRTSLLFKLLNIPLKYKKGLLAFLHLALLLKFNDPRGSGWDKKAAGVICWMQKPRV